ncbi:MAG: hypothetical protein HND52_05840 [Ignavibacteriae bacterium]|nr:hypothetical protein [Ignavibacteriota bacterium]NOG97472.1 hypothetical protein [Ignavibacteriota bacterium]
MKFLFLLFLFFTHIEIAAQTTELEPKINSLWKILEKKDASSLSDFFNQWEKESAPLPREDLNKLMPILRNAYAIIENYTDPFEDYEKLDTIKPIVPYVIFPTNVTIKVMDSTFFLSSKVAKESEYIIEELNYNSFKPLLKINRKKVLFLPDQTIAIIDTMIEEEDEDYLNSIILMLSPYVSLRNGYFYNLSRYVIEFAILPFPSTIYFNEALNRAKIFFYTNYFSAMEVSFIKEDKNWSIDKSKSKKIITY